MNILRQAQDKLTTNGANEKQRTFATENTEDTEKNKKWIPANGLRE